MFKFLKVFIKSFTHKKISYSYGGIDSLILNIFKNQKKGFYLDIGCGHPIKNNNTYLLNKKGWSGMNIDLDKDNIDLFNSYRKNDVNLSIAVSDKEGETDLFFYHSKSALNTISKQNADFQKADVSAIKKIKTQTINNIIENSSYKDEKIDFLSIDVEGSELEVLKSIDFSFPIFCIIIEADSRQQEKNKIFGEYLKSNGFKFKERQRGNEVWINHNCHRKGLFNV